VQLLIEHAPPDSWRIRLFCKLANGAPCPTCAALSSTSQQAMHHRRMCCPAGPWRMDLLRYYAETADQVQRLLRVTANGDSCSWLKRSMSFGACTVTSLARCSHRLEYCLHSASWVGLIMQNCTCCLGKS